MSSKILFIGYSEDKTLKHLINIATDYNVNVTLLNLDVYYDNGYVEYDSLNKSCASLVARDKAHHLQEFDGIYQRIMLPKKSFLPGHNWPNIIARLTALTAVLFDTDTLVVNRPLYGWENGAKLLQSFFLREEGFNIPSSLSTSIARDYINFRKEGACIYKSNSAVRSVVDDVTEKVEQSRLEFLRNCPVLFQRRIRGRDVRVHVVNGAIFPVEIDSDAIDYRYYGAKGTFCNLSPCYTIPESIEKKCISYGKKSGVVFSGFDFKVDSKGTWYCLEMNPMPSFESYDRVIDNKIAKKLIETLSNKEAKDT